MNSTNERIQHLNWRAFDNAREYVPLLKEAGFTEIETGPTSSRLLSFVRGKAPGN
jgi:hypothetical protein